MYFLYYPLDAVIQRVKGMLNSLNIAWRLVAKKLTNHGKGDVEHVGDAIATSIQLRTFGSEGRAPYPSIY